MKKEDILRKSKNMRDEREQSIEFHSFKFGGCVITVLIVAFSIWTVYRGGTIFGYAAVLFGYLSASQLFTFKKLKNKSALLVGCMASIVTPLNIIMLFIRG